MIQFCPFNEIISFKFIHPFFFLSSGYVEKDNISANIIIGIFSQLQYFHGL